MKLKWVFPPTGGGVSQGFNDSSQEIFRDNSLKNAMREVIQNSLDAVDDKSRPVEVAIQTMDVPSSELGAKELSKHVKQAQIWTEDKRNADGVEFYDKALKMLRRKSIPVLAITDSKHERPERGQVGHPDPRGGHHQQRCGCGWRQLRHRQERHIYGVGRQGRRIFNALFGARENRVLYSTLQAVSTSRSKKPRSCATAHRARHKGQSGEEQARASHARQRDLCGL